MHEYKICVRLDWLTGVTAACALGLLPLDALNAAEHRVDELVHAALELDANVGRGESLYRANCAGCHGPKALGDAARLVPAIAGQRTAYLIKQLADFTELERESPHMQAVVAQARLGEPQVWADIASYVNGLPVGRFPERGDGTGVALGEAIFREQCATCHEEDARGDDEGFVPSLRNQHYSYVLRQMRALTSWHRLGADADLVRFLDSLDTEELTAVADYLSRMQGPTRDRSKLRDDGTVSD